MLVRFFSVVTSGSFIFIAGALGWMASDRSIPFTVTEDRLNSPSVSPGGALERSITYIQRKRCWIHSDRMIIDAANVRHMLEPFELQSGIGALNVKQTYVLKIPIPKDIAIGPARFESLTVYKCNLLQLIWPIYGPYHPVPFEVVPQ